jgi:hypothetical protein
VAGEVAVLHGVALGQAVVLAVRQVLQDRGHGRFGGALGQPQARAQPGAVAQGDPGVFNDLDMVREVGANGHGGSAVGGGG